jgi:hypothetical protein
LESFVEVDVAGEVSEVFNSGNYDHEVRVVSCDASYEKIHDGLSFVLGEYVASHNISIVEMNLNALSYSISMIERIMSA